MPTSETPKRHYGRSGVSPEYTPCGQYVADVVVTYDPDRVTCSDCAHEIGVDQGSGDFRPKLEQQGGDDRD